MAGTVFRFGSFELDTRARELRRDGRRIRLQRQPFQVLAILVENAGAVVTRDELRAQIWPATVYVDFDHGLNNAVNRIRHALGDIGGEADVIETVPRVGYRFVCPVAILVPRGLADTAGPRPSASAAVPASLGSPPPSSLAIATSAPMVRRLAAVAVVLALTIGVVVPSARNLAGFHGTNDNHYKEMNSSGERTDGSAAVDPAAYDAYMQARRLWNQRSSKSVVESIAYYQRAIELDPAFAPAYVGLAMAFVSAGGNTLTQSVDAAEVRGPALAAARRALEIDETRGDAHAVLAQVLERLYPWSAETDILIEQAYRRAIDLSPEDAEARLWYGNYLSVHGRSDDAIEQYRAALRLDPSSPNIGSRLGAALVDAGRTDEGLARLEETVEQHPRQFNARIRLAWAYASLRRLEEAKQQFDAAETISPENVPARVGIAFVTARSGDAESARDMLDALLPEIDRVGDPYLAAIVFVALGDRDNAIAWLGRAAENSRTLRRASAYGIQSPLYDWLRDDPRFVELQRRIEIVTTAAEAPGSTETVL